MITRADVGEQVVVFMGAGLVQILGLVKDSNDEYVVLELANDHEITIRKPEVIAVVRHPSGSAAGWLDATREAAALEALARATEADGAVTDV